MMKDLNEFQIPLTGEITLCEVDGKIHSLSHGSMKSYEVDAITRALKRHPKIHITQDILHCTNAEDEIRTFFIETEVPFLKRLIQTYYECGVLETLKVASKGQKFIVSDFASLLLQCIEISKAIKSKWKLAIVNDSDPDDLLLPSRNTFFSNINCISWHPHSLKIAVACSDDTVRIYFDNASVGPILKYKQQKNISCIEWRPLSLSEIAVGCSNGVYVWNVDPFIAITRPTISNATLLYQVNHVPIANIAWSPRGDLLATCSSFDSTVLVWDVELKENSPLKRPGGSGNHLLKWSSNGSKLFAASCGTKFRVWNCFHWDAELWEINSGKVSAACWSPCGSALLFASSQEPFIYYLPSDPKISAFNSKSAESNEAVPIVDCSQIEKNGNIVGGLIRDMQWDPEGRHVAVLFQRTKYVAIFRTKISPVLQIFPSALIGGTVEESPRLIQFQKNFESGACLTIAWSSGRIQHFPIIYSNELQSSFHHPFNTSRF